MPAFPDSNLAAHLSVRFADEESPKGRLLRIAIELCCYLHRMERMRLGLSRKHQLWGRPRGHYIDEPSDGVALSCPDLEASFDIQAFVRDLAVNHPN